MKATATGLRYVSSKWTGFKTKGEYLTTPYKCLLNKKLDEIHWPEAQNRLWNLFDNPLSQKEKQYKQSYKKIKKEILTYNTTYEKTEIEKYINFFNGKKYGLSNGLDSDQEIAIVRDDKHNLLIAGAGSGKTNVLVHKIAYLVKEKGIDPKKILTLCYNSKAAEEVNERVKGIFNISTNISTFHSFGLKICRTFDKRNRKIINEPDLNEFFNKQVMNSKRSLNLTSFIVDYLQNRIDNTVLKVKEAKFETMLRKYENSEYEALDKSRLRSEPERRIANFLIEHGIDYDYEPPIDLGKGIFMPAFYLPKYALYILYWDINSEGEVPEWFPKSTKLYTEGKACEKSQLIQEELSTIECFSFESDTGSLLENLKKNLKETVPNIKLDKLSKVELIKNVFEINLIKDEVASLVKTFVSNSKTFGHTPKGISEKILSGVFDIMQGQFATLSNEYYRDYQSFLAKTNHIDFDDMILNAVSELKSHEFKGVLDYDYILIDEFQDISTLRLAIIQHIVKLQPHTKLFCVGDDYQSIYGFAGSNVDIFINFKDYFDSPNQMLLKKNYRSCKEIVAAGNGVIANNKNQIDKEQVAISKDEGNIALYEVDDIKYPAANSRIAQHVWDEIKGLLGFGVDKSEILILARYNKSLELLTKLIKREGYESSEFEMMAIHKSKGLQAEYVFILDLFDDSPGFPSKIESNHLLQIVNGNHSQPKIEEERRLFYVGITRSKRVLKLYTKKSCPSVFCSEIKPYLTSIETVGFVAFSRGGSKFKLPV